MQFMKWRILLSDFRCRKKHRGQLGERRHQTILILILTQDHMYTGFFLGFMYITRVRSTSHQQVSFLLKGLTHPIDLTHLNRTPVIGCGVLLAGRMTAWCSVIIVQWIVKEPSAIKQATVSVLCALLFLPFPVCFCCLYTTLLSLFCTKKQTFVILLVTVEACVTGASGYLTPRTPDLDVRGSKPRPLLCFLRQGALLHFVSLHPGV